MLDWWLPENVSTYGRDIDWLFHLIYWITGLTAILVFATMLVFLVMYRDRPGRRARYTHGNTTLELVWTVIPSLILVVLTFLSAPAWSRIKIQAPPASDFVMHVPVNKVVHVHLRSQDVIHSFFVPNFRMKQDAVPGREIVQWFEATKTGKYELPCAELCGFGHSGMRGWIYVHTPADYQKWAAENLRAEAAPAAAEEKKPEEAKPQPAPAKGGKAKR